ncbi:FecCD family ABC transporter permease [Pseudonocardia phyllosphaerae]|uniref:FecCD family ABC transporter permease n=1 Tax=Pseudonocardia phyllosphaerae TaxID=3390502 RepID=UPI00397915ED
MLVTVLLVATVAAATLSVSVGSVGVPVGTVWQVVATRTGLTDPVAGADPVVDQIVWSVRVPRTVLAMLAGAGLSVAGAVIQTVVRNPLGDPYLIGIVPGAGLGAVTVIVAGSAAVGGLSLSAAAFAGGLLAFAVVFLLGRQQGKWPPARLVLAGVAVGYLVSSVTFFLQTIAAPNQVQRVLFWTLGSVAGARWADLAVPAVVIALGTAWLVLNGRRLNTLVNGTDLAASLGIAVGRFQLQLMALTALVTGSVVAVAGGIGFIGLVVPHVARLLVGADHRRVLVTSVLLGSVSLPLADVAARTLRAPAELPIGIVTAAIGAPFFLWLLRATSRPARRSG